MTGEAHFYLTYDKRRQKIQMTSNENLKKVHLSFDHIFKHVNICMVMQKQVLFYNCQFIDNYKFKLKNTVNK